MALGISVGWQKREECWLIRNSLRLFPESRSVRYTRHTHTQTLRVHDALSVGRLVFMLMFEHDCGPLTVDLQVPKPAAVCATCGNNKRPTTVLYYQAHTVYTIIWNLLNNIHNRASTTCCATSSSEQEQQQHRISFRSKIFINVIWQAYEYCVCLQNLHMTQKQSTTTATQKLLNKRNY